MVFVPKLVQNHYIDQNLARFFLKTTKNCRFFLKNLHFFKNFAAFSGEICASFMVFRARFCAWGLPSFGRGPTPCAPLVYMGPKIRKKIDPLWSNIFGNFRRAWGLLSFDNRILATGGLIAWFRTVDNVGRGFLRCAGFYSTPTNNVLLPFYAHFIAPDKKCFQKNPLSSHIFSNFLLILERFLIFIISH